MKSHVKSVHGGKENKCKPCGISFTDAKDLKRHVTVVHERKRKMQRLLNKQNEMILNINHQKTLLYKDILKLKEKENIDKFQCKCRGFCRINHSRYSWVKSHSGVILSRIEKQLEDDIICNQWNKEVTDERAFENHIHNIHNGNARSQGEQCDKDSANEDRSGKHVKQIHEPYFGQQSTRCNLFLEDEANLIDHIGTNHH